MSEEDTQRFLRKVVTVLVGAVLVVLALCIAAMIVAVSYNAIRFALGV